MVRSAFDGGEGCRRLPRCAPNACEAEQGVGLFLGIADLGEESPRSREELLGLGQTPEIQIDTAQVGQGYGLADAVTLLLEDRERLPEDPLRLTALPLPVKIPAQIVARHGFPTPVSDFVLERERTLEGGQHLLPGVATESAS